jgi:hypothetical protein
LFPRSSPRTDQAQKAGAPALAELERMFEAPRTTQYLTRELLSWATNALEAVFVTPECQNSPKARREVLAAMMTLDDLYTPIFHREALDHG